MTQLPAHKLDFLHDPSDAADPPVTVVRDLHVRPQHRAAFETAMSALMKEAMRQPGHLGATVVRPRTEAESYRFIYKFDRRSHLRAWHDSARRAELIAPVLGIIESERADEYPGLETWFELPGESGGRSPPKWKTTLMSSVAIYVAVLGMSYLLAAIGFEASLPVRTLVMTVIVVPLVAYVLAPFLARVLHRWLWSGL